MNQEKNPVKGSLKSADKRTNSSNEKIIVDDDIRDATVQKWSKGALSVRQDPTQGAYVVANRSISPGEILLECPSTSIALDSTYRFSHCGFCAMPVVESLRTRTPLCQHCHVIAICKKCHDQGAEQWHSKSGECCILLSLVESFQQVFVEMTGLTLPEVAQNVDSIYMLVMRLVSLRRQKSSNSLSACPLPYVDWDVFDALYTSPLPSSDGASAAAVKAMATLLEVAATKLQQKQKQPAQITFDLQECVSIWNKCRGCCHGITDLSRPLGSQNLGMALFAPQSFYNHACAPNAFLSCILAGENKTIMNHATVRTGSTDKDDHLCAVISRVVNCSQTAVDAGAPVTISYIPMSGLCQQERRMRLNQTYHFTCHCQMCQEATVAGTDGFVVEQHVGGDFAKNHPHDQDLVAVLDPLRELQIGCYQQLMQASTLPPDDSEKGIERIELAEQVMTNLRMAQRGIRNNNIPPSHEVALECHRLLAVAFAIIRGDPTNKDMEEIIKEELTHHRSFFEGVKPAEAILDPSALTLQHELMVQCLEAELECNSVDRRTQQEIQHELDEHLSNAEATAERALGKDHPLVMSQVNRRKTNKRKRNFENNVSTEDGMASFADEVTAEIYSFLGAIGTVRCASACKQWYLVCKHSRNLWRRFVYDDFGLSVGDANADWQAIYAYIYTESKRVDVFVPSVLVFCDDGSHQPGNSPANALQQNEDCWCTNAFVDHDVDLVADLGTPHLIQYFLIGNGNYNYSAPVKEALAFASFDLPDLETARAYDGEAGIGLARRLDALQNRDRCKKTVSSDRCHPLAGFNFPFLAYDFSLSKPLLRPTVARYVHFKLLTSSKSNNRVSNNIDVRNLHTHGRPLPNLMAMLYPESPSTAARHNLPPDPSNRYQRRHQVRPYPWHLHTEFRLQELQQDIEQMAQQLLGERADPRMMNVLDPIDWGRDFQNLQAMALQRDRPERQENNLEQARIRLADIEQRRQEEQRIQEQETERRLGEVEGVRRQLVGQVQQQYGRNMEASVQLGREARELAGAASNAVEQQREQQRQLHELVASRTVEENNAEDLETNNYGSDGDGADGM